MSSMRYTLRAHGRYTVTVGWDDELQTFLAHVEDELGSVASLGTTPHEIPTLSQLVDAVGRFADLDTTTISALRRAAGPPSRDGSPAALSH